MGVEQIIGPWPVLGQPQPGSAGAADQAASDMEDALAERAWFGHGEAAGERKCLCPDEQIGCREDHLHPRRVRGERDEGHTPASASPVGSRQQNIGWNPNLRLKRCCAPCLHSERISTSDASTSNTIASGAPPAAHALARAATRAVRGACSTVSSIASNVRQIVGRKRLRRTRQADPATPPFPQCSGHRRRAPP